MRAKKCRVKVVKVSRSSDLRRTVLLTTVGAACVGVVGLGGTAHADTIHRYSFNTAGQAEDTGTLAGNQGPSNGTILNGATVSGGVLTTTDTGSGAAGTNPEVSLPGFNTIDDYGSSSTSFSIEDFFTRSATSTNNYSTLFSLSDGSTTNYILASPGRGDGTNQYGLAIKQVGVNGGAEVDLRGGILAPGSTNVSVQTFNASTGTATLFVNGVAAAQSAVGQLTGLTIGSFDIKDGIAGNDPYADKGLAGTTDDFRLDNTSLTATQVAINYLNGSNNNTGTITTDNGIASGDYNDGSTYDNGVPTATEQVIINNTKTLSSGTGLAGILTIGSTGTLNINGGTIAPATNLDIDGGGTVNLNTGGTLSIKGITVDGDVTSTNSAAHTINLNGGIFQAAGNFFAPATNIALNVNTASTVDSQGFSISLPGTVTGSAALTKIGSGTVAFTGGNSSAYTGAINVSGGTFGVGYSAGTHTGASAFSNAINLDPSNSGATGIAFTIGQTVPTDVTSTITLGAPTIAAVYSVTGGSGTNDNGNFIGKVTGGNANTTLSLTGFFKFDAPTSDFTGNVQINANTGVALAGPNSLGGTTRTLISNGGGLEPQNATALTGANEFLNPISVLANQAIYFTNNFPIDVGSNITGTLSSGLSVSDIQKSGTGTVKLLGTSTNIRNVIMNGGGGTAATPRIIQFDSNFTATNSTTDNVATGLGARGSYFDDNQGGNNDVQYAELANNVTVNNLVLQSKGRSLAASPLVAGIVLNNLSGNNTWGGGLEIVNGGGGHRINVASGNLTIGGIVNNNVTGGNRGYELTGAGNGIFTASLLDGNQYNATSQTASQLSFTMIGETTGTSTTGNGSWSINSTGNNFSGGLNVINGSFYVNGSTTSTSTAASNVIGVYGGRLGGTGSIAQPVTVYAAGAAAPGNFLSLNPASTTSVALGGTIDPGNATTPIATLTLGNALTVNGGVAEEYDGTGSGSSDKLGVAGALTLGGGSTLSLTDLNVAADDAAYVLASYGTLSGTFGTVTGLPTGYTLNYTYLGNEIALIGSVAPSTLYFTGSSTNSLNTAANYSTDLAGASVASTTPGGATDVSFASTNGKNLSTTLASNLTVNSLTFGTGAVASNAVTIGGPGTLTINAAAVGYPAGTGVTVQSGAASVTIAANVALAVSQSWTNNSANTFAVSGGVNLGANTLTLAGSGNDTFSGAVSGTGGLAVTGTAKLNVASIGSVSVTTLNSTTAIANAGTISESGGGSIDSITGAGTLNVTGGTLALSNPTFGTLNTQSAINLSGSGVLDLKKNQIQVNGNQYNTLVSAFKAGSLTSSSITTGRTIGINYNGTTTLARYTLAGDADLDGSVSINDFNTLAANFGTPSGATWAQGDFDYDGSVSINDFNALAANFGVTLSATGSAERSMVDWAPFIAFAEAHNDLTAFQAATGVPEPTSLAVLGVAAAFGLRRRRAV